jgi:hypothetical protein
MNFHSEYYAKVAAALAPSFDSVTTYTDYDASVINNAADAHGNGVVPIAPTYVQKAPGNDPED